MENKFTPELIEKAKSAKTPEELMALAKENGMELTEESAKAYFEQLNPKTGELADEELDNVSGGACYDRNGCLMTTIGYGCRHFERGAPGDGAHGASGTCCACRYWDRYYRTGAEIFGAPLPCVHPKNNKRK